MRLSACTAALLVLVGAVSSQKWGGPGGYSRQNFIPAPLAHDGRVVDTPEIAHLKQAHFAAHEDRLRALPPRGPYSEYRGPQDYGQTQPPQQQYRAPPPNYETYDDDGDYNPPQQEKKWRGPLAKIEFTPDGKFIKDTPEVQHAKAQHFAALQAAKKHEGPSDRQYGYEGEHNYNSQYDDGRYKGEGEADAQYRPELYKPNVGPGSDGYEGEGQRFRDYQGQGQSQGQGQGGQGGQYFRPPPNNRYY